MPHFETEREEADWWFQNQDLVAAMFEETYGTPDPVFLAVDLEGEDALLICKLAANVNMEPHVYAANFLHKVLHSNEAA